MPTSEPRLTPEQRATLTTAAAYLGRATGRTTIAARQAIFDDPATLATLADQADALGGGASGLAAELRELQAVLIGQAETPEPSAGKSRKPKASS